jgi:2-keto-4-pentenoate hydratase/2-oxohepta-3-ene-1,7-dioic acid hydratase in catechol pathway
MLKLAVVALTLFTAGSVACSPRAQGGGTPLEPFKLGTFREGARTFVGVVLRDSLVADLGEADLALPSDLKTLIARYETPDVRAKVLAVANAVVSATGARPAYVHDLGGLAVLPPVVPRIILNAALNYQEHANELAENPGVVAGVSAADVRSNQTPVGSIDGVWERKPGDTRHNPYFFHKPTTALIGHGEPIRLPPGRDQIDAECELTLVVGRTASHVAVEQADDHIFGYTIQNDVSDRRGRQDDRHGSDWLMAKGFDTFAPIGPFVVPKEFVPDPQALAIKLTLNDEVMTDSNTAGMTHDVRELLSFVSHVVTLQPGDMIDTGSAAGVGASRGLFLKSGDVSTCAIERVGTLRNPVQ